MKFLKSIFAMPVFVILLLLSIPVYAGQIELSWRAPNTPPDFVKYRIRWGERSGEYTHRKDVNSDKTSVTITGLTNKKTYYFVATTITRSGKESPYSNEVRFYLDADTDGDGILDREERNVYGTDPTLADTDGDGINDKDELSYWGGAWDADTDGDGRINLLDADADNDGTSDGEELEAGYDPGDPDSTIPRPVEPEKPSPLPIASVSASDEQAPNVAVNTTDGDLNTRWAAEGDGQWIMFDLGTIAALNQVAIAWVKGDQRQASFDVEGSTDGDTWTTIFSGDGSGTTTELESYSFPSTPVRYVRIVGYGNTVNRWNNIAEVELYGQLSTMPLPIESVRASASQAPNVAGNVTDGDLTTRWAAEGDGQWLIVDLGTIASINQVAISWVKGNQRQASFAIEASMDGEAWNPVFSGDSSGTTTALEPYAFPFTPVRYVRIVGYGNSTNMWNNIAEVELYGFYSAMSLPIASVQASEAEAPNVAVHTIDKDLSTRWAAEGDGQWIRYDLGSLATVGEVAIAWVKGNRRQASFSIEVSLDGDAWDRVFTGNSSGTTTELESYSFSFVEARYVRIVGHGNSVNMWNNIAETEIDGMMN